MEMNRYETKYWYSLREVIEQWDSTCEPYSWGATTEFLTDYLSENEINTPNSLIVSSSLATEIEQLFIYVYARFNSHYCFSINEESNTVATYKECKDWWYKFLNICVFTYPKYKELLAYQAAQANKLMDGVKVSTTGQIRFNDTPQDITAVSDDKFASNLTKSVQESESGMNTPVERLKEINEKFISIYKEWTNEFDKIFIEEGNI